MYCGEAPESDDEILAFSNIKLGTAEEVDEEFVTQQRHEPFNGKSVLQKMLGKKSLEYVKKDNFIYFISLLYTIIVDCNHSFWHHLNQTIQNTVVTASSQILAAEELLIQSQLIIQAVSRSVKQANEIADQILTKFQDILSSEFLPDIKIPT